MRKAINLRRIADKVQKQEQSRFNCPLENKEAMQDVLVLMRGEVTRRYSSAIVNIATNCTLIQQSTKQQLRPCYTIVTRPP